jgi:hypothetical protein
MPPATPQGQQAHNGDPHGQRDVHEPKKVEEPGDGGDGR